MTKTDKFFAVFLSVLFAAFVVYMTYITGYRVGRNDGVASSLDHCDTILKGMEANLDHCRRMNAIEVKSLENQLAIYKSAFERLRAKQPEVREVVREVARDDRPEFRNEGGVLVWEPKYPLMPIETGPPTE